MAGDPLDGGHHLAQLRRRDNHLLAGAVFFQRQDEILDPLGHRRTRGQPAFEQGQPLKAAWRRPA
ncbi:MAG: hypothetical protein EA424_02500, partial [Planctomycetaceae bacterium]